MTLARAVLPRRNSSPLAAPLADHWARVVTALLAPLACLAAPVAALLKPHAWGLLEKLWILPAPLALAAYVATRLIARRVLRRASPAWLATHAGRVEAAAKAATLVLAGLAIPLASSAATLLGLEPDSCYGVRFWLGLVTICGAWVQPALMSRAILLGKPTGAAHAVAALLAALFFLAALGMCLLTVFAGPAMLIFAGVSGLVHLATFSLAKRLQSSRWPTRPSWRKTSSSTRSGDATSSTSTPASKA